MYQSRFYQRDITNRRDIYNLLQQITLHDCGGLLGRSEICRAGQQAENSWTGADAAVHRKNFFFLRGILVLLLRPFNCFDDIHSDYGR